MATEKNISQLPSATGVNASDFIHVSQGGVDKKIPATDMSASFTAGQVNDPVVKEESSTSRTLTIADKYAYIQCSNTSLTTITVLADTFKAGNFVNLRNVNGGGVTLAAGAGVTISGSSSGLTLSEDKQVGTLLCTGTNTFDFMTGGSASTSIQGAITFADVATMISGDTLEGGTISDWSGYVGWQVHTVVNNTTSNAGGARYTIVNVNPGNLSTLVGGVWVGENHDLGGGLYAKMNRQGVFANAMSFGFKCDGSDDSAAFSAVAAAGFVEFPENDYTGTFTLSNISDTTFTFAEGAIVTSVGSSQALQINSSSTSINIYGGHFSSELRVSRVVAITGSNRIHLRKVTASFATKSTYVGAAIYGTAGIFIDTCSRCSVIECEAYNIEGFGIAIIGTGGGHLVERSYIHDNVGGILNNSNDNNFNRYIENDIGFNDVSPGGSGNDGILVNATDIDNSSSGHEISGNRIYSSGEHAMYIQCANTIISNNRCYSNDTCGIKMAKCRNVQITNNTCFDNNSNIQVQSGYEDILIEGNSCYLSLGAFDLDFTWNIGLDPFGGRSVKIIGNYFLSDVATWSADIDGTEGVIFENNTCAKGLIYSANASPVDYENVRIKDNEFLDGVIRIIRCSSPVISGNKAVSLYCPDSNSNVILRNNEFTALTVATRKDLALDAFKEISGNTIASPDVGGAPNYEIFNGQDAVVDSLQFFKNTITTAGAIIVNVNTSGGITNSVFNGNIFDDGGGGTAVSITTASSGNSFVGNVGMSGTVTSTNSTGVANTGGATFGGAGSSYANNI